jgi:hypothetical protein
MSPYLKSPNDWDAFEKALISKASSEFVLHLMQLGSIDEYESLKLNKPKKPEFKDYKAKAPSNQEAS